MENKTYFLPGDLVTIRQEVPSKPLMIVVKKVIKYYAPTNREHFQGILCRWFTTEGLLQECVWNTKDLIKL